MEYVVYSCCMNPESADYGRGQQFEGSFPTLAEAQAEVAAIQGDIGHPAAWYEIKQ